MYHLLSMISLSIASMTSVFYLMLTVHWLLRYSLSDNSRINFNSFRLSNHLQNLYSAVLLLSAS